MQIELKNRKLDKLIIGINALTSALITASFVMLFGGFEKPILPERVLYAVQTFLLFIFIAEKVIRFFNATSKVAYLRINWFEIPLLAALVITVLGAGHWFAEAKIEAERLRHYAIGIYLVL